MGNLNFGFGSGGGGSGVQSVVGTAMEIIVDSTDPQNPIVSLAVQVTGALAAALTAVQPGANISVFNNNAGYITAASLPAAANPSASLGLAAVNGVAATFMRSDAAPALDQGIAPTWTAQHIFTGATGAVVISAATADLVWIETDAGADGKRWRLRANANALNLATRTDADGVGSNAIDVARSGIAVTTIQFGNTTDLPRSAFFGVVRLRGYTVATLPAGTAGDTAYVTNALAPSFGATVAGGGAVTVPVFYDGANWIVG